MFPYTREEERFCIYRKQSFVTKYISINKLVFFYWQLVLGVFTVYDLKLFPLSHCWIPGFTIFVVYINIHCFENLHFIFKNSSKLQLDHLISVSVTILILWLFFSGTLLRLHWITQILVRTFLDHLPLSLPLIFYLGKSIYDTKILPKLRTNR